MKTTKQFVQSLVGDLYGEALILTDALRPVFAPRASAEAADEDKDADALKVATSCLGMRMLSRMLHATGWIRDWQDHLATQDDNGRMGPVRWLDPALLSDAVAMPVHLPAHVTEMVGEMAAFCDKLVRLEGRWRARTLPFPNAVHALQWRVDAHFNAFTVPCGQPARTMRAG